MFKDGLRVEAYNRVENESVNIRFDCGGVVSERYKGGSVKAKGLSEREGRRGWQRARASVSIGGFRILINYRPASNSISRAYRHAH